MYTVTVKYTDGEEVTVKHIDRVEYTSGNANRIIEAEKLCSTPISLNSSLSFQGDNVNFLVNSGARYIKIEKET